MAVTELKDVAKLDWRLTRPSTIPHSESYCIKFEQCQQIATVNKLQEDKQYGLLLVKKTVLWSRNFLFPLRLRLSKRFGSGSGAGSDISFTTTSTFYYRFHIKKWIFHVFL